MYQALLLTLLKQLGPQVISIDELINALDLTDDEDTEAGFLLCRNDDGKTITLTYETEAPEDAVTL